MNLGHMGRLMKCISFFPGPDFIHLFTYILPRSTNYILFYFDVCSNPVWNKVGY